MTPQVPVGSGSKRAVGTQPAQVSCHTRERGDPVLGELVRSADGLRQGPALWRVLDSRFRGNDAGGWGMAVGHSAGSPRHPHPEVRAQRASKDPRRYTARGSRLAFGSHLTMRMLVVGHDAATASFRRRPESSAQAVVQHSALRAHRWLRRARDADHVVHWIPACAGMTPRLLEGAQPKALLAPTCPHPRRHPRESGDLRLSRARCPQTEIPAFAGMTRGC
jgi:hypothetical protein